MHNCGADTHTFDQLRVDHFVTKHNKMCSLPYTMTANKTYLSTYFPFKTSLFIKRMSLINKVNFKKWFSEIYKRMRLTTRVYGNGLCPCRVYGIIMWKFNSPLLVLHPAATQHLCIACINQTEGKRKLTLQSCYYLLYIMQRYPYITGDL